MSLYDYGLGTLAQYELTADRKDKRSFTLLYSSGTSDPEGISRF